MPKSDRKKVGMTPGGRPYKSEVKDGKRTTSVYAGTAKTYRKQGKTKTYVGNSGAGNPNVVKEKVMSDGLYGGRFVHATVKKGPTKPRKASSPGNDWASDKVKQMKSAKR